MQFRHRRLLLIFPTACGNCRRCPFNYWGRLLIPYHVFNRRVLTGVFIILDGGPSTAFGGISFIFRAHYYCNELIQEKGRFPNLSRKSSIGLRWLFCFSGKSSRVFWRYLHLKPHVLGFSRSFPNRHRRLLLVLYRPFCCRGIIFIDRVGASSFKASRIRYCTALRGIGSYIKCSQKVLLYFYYLSLATSCLVENIGLPNGLPGQPHSSSGESTSTNWCAPYSSSPSGSLFSIGYSSSTTAKIPRRSFSHALCR